MKGMRERTKAIGGVGLGAALALAGSFGVAVGVYTLPDPQSSAIDAHVYARLDQHAVAVATLSEDESSRIVLRIEASRGASSYVDVLARGDGDVDQHADPTTGVSFTAFKQECTNDGFCQDLDYWASSVPSDWFVFDPLMESASFSGTVAGCAFDIVWTGEGMILPIGTRPEPPYNTGNQHADVTTQGTTELSRVAPAHIDTCFQTVDGPGYIGLGERKDVLHAHLYPYDG